ncbi:MAG: formimidoylglutamate deiminase [Caulobacteraceae bacterium]
MAGLWFETALLPDGLASSVRVEHAGGVITAVQQDVAPAPGDERHTIGVPGLANVHSHAFQRGMAGLAETSGPASDDFWTWREVMYRFLDHMTPEDLEAITAFAFAEMLQAGFTRVGEFHYVHHDPAGLPYADIGELSARVASAASATGIGLTLLPVFYAHSDFGGAPPKPGQRRFINDVTGFARLYEAAKRAIDGLDRANIGVAPHSLRAVTPQELGAVVELAPNGPVHIHAAEQTREVEACVAWRGQRPVEWLLDHAGVDHRWCLIHTTHLTADEINRLARSGAVAGLCPITEANLGDGVFPAQTFLAAGGRFGVGTDSNILVDAAGELRALEYAQRLTLRGRNILAGEAHASTGGRLYRSALCGGAQALGVAPSRIAPGGAADLVSLDGRNAAFIGRSGDALLDGWIFTGGAGAIDCVWRGGKKVVEQGRHHRSEEVHAAYRRTLTRLLAQ